VTIINPNLSKKEEMLSLYIIKYKLYLILFLQQNLTIIPPEESLSTKQLFRFYLLLD